jgi:hypothetical protein
MEIKLKACLHIWFYGLILQSDAIWTGIVILKTLINVYLIDKMLPSVALLRYRKSLIFKLRCWIISAGLFRSKSQETAKSDNEIRRVSLSLDSEGVKFQVSNKYFFPEESTLRPK